MRYNPQISTDPLSLFTSHMKNPATSHITFVADLVAPLHGCKGCHDSWRTMTKNGELDPQPSQPAYTNFSGF